MNSYITYRHKSGNTFAIHLQGAMNLHDFCMQILDSLSLFDKDNWHATFYVKKNFGANSTDTMRTIEAVSCKTDTSDWRMTVGKLFFEQYGHCEIYATEMRYNEEAREIYYYIGIGEEEWDNKANFIARVQELLAETIEHWYDKEEQDCDGHTLGFKLGYKTGLNTGLRACLDLREKVRNESED